MPIIFPIKGYITDANGRPLTGASIRVKGSTTGTLTGQHGAFSIQVEEGQLLTVTFIGYVTMEVRVTANGITLAQGSAGQLVKEEDGWKFRMASAETALEEVTINKGYYNTTRKFNTGNVSKVSSREISQQPVGNPLNALQGRMAGVQIVQTSGVPGSPVKVQIRGLNSLRTNNEANSPLFIVDGVPFDSRALGMRNAVISQYTPFNALNPNDIASIEVLKDADATAIYGSRGANGVMLITTKKGKPGKTRLEIALSQAMGKTSRFMRVMNTREYLDVRYESFANDNMPIWGAELLRWDTTRYTDWQKELLGGTAMMTNAQVNISGGTQNTQFLLGGNVIRETAVFPGSNANTKGGGHLNLNHQSENTKFRMALSVNYNFDHIIMPNADLTDEAIRLPPHAPEALKENGDMNVVENFANPYAYIFSRFNSSNEVMIANLNVSYELLPGLALKANLGYNTMRSDEMNLNTVKANAAASSPIGSAAFGNGRTRSWVIEPQLDYNLMIRDSRFSAQLGSTLHDNVTRRQSLFGTGYTNDAFIENFLAAPEKIYTGFSYNQYRYTALFARVSYQYNGKYLLNLTGRRDGSSRFGPGRQFGNFGAVGLGWIFSEEPWLNSEIITYGKLRASYGVTGSDGIPDYGYMSTYLPVDNYDNNTAAIPSRLENPQYAWESVRKFETGLELGFLEDRFFLTVSWFRNRSSNQLIGMPLSGVTGFSSLEYFNLPATVQNTGWEFELSSTNVRSRHFAWKTALNLNIPRNKLVSFPGISAFPFYEGRYEVGQPLAITYKLFRYTGVDPQTGLYTFEDRNKDSKYDDNDMYLRAFTGRQLEAGFGNTFTYRNWSLDIFFQFVKQNGPNFFLSPLASPLGNLYNQPAFLLDHWRKPGDRAEYQRAGLNGGPSTLFYRATASDLAYSDASFIRFKTLSLSYSFRQHAMRAFLNCQNLFTITNYKGIDPETLSFSSMAVLRMISLGFNITL